MCKPKCAPSGRALLRLKGHHLELLGLEREEQQQEVLQDLFLLRVQEEIGELTDICTGDWWVFFFALASLSIPVWRPNVCEFEVSETQHSSVHQYKWPLFLTRLELFKRQYVDGGRVVLFLSRHVVPPRRDSESEPFDIH